MPPPNILFIVADDHRHDAIGACGDPLVRTPALDGLCAGGTALRRNYMMGGMSAAVCVPARAALHTGCNPFRASKGGRGRGNIGALDSELPLLAETFRRAGYHTFATGKWHNCRASFARSFAAGARIFFGGMSDHERVPLHDFDPQGEYADEAKYQGQGFSTELFAGAAIEFLQQYREEKPFFLYLAFTAPHDPRTAPAEFARRCDPEKVPLPENFLREHPFDNGELHVRDEQLAGLPRSAGEVKRHIAEYCAMIEHMDHWIGRVLEALEQSGRAANSIVVYTADHGLALGQHGLMGKQNLYEHSVRVPLIMRGPGVPEGRRLEALSSTYDLYPTLCRMAGLQAPDTVEGESLLPLLRGEAEKVRDSVFSVYRDLQRMVCDGRWKLIRYYRSAQTGAGSERVQLFDLERDPREMEDLSGARPEEVERLAALLQAWQGRVDDPLRERPTLPV